MMFWHSFWRIFVRSPEAAPPCCPPPFGAFTAYTDHSRAGEVWLGCGPQSSPAPFRIPISFRFRPVKSAGGSGFAFGPDLLLFLSGLLPPHRSGWVPNTSRLYSAVTHHTHNTLYVLGSLYLDLVGLVAVGQKVRSNFTSPGPWCAPR